MPTDILVTTPTSFAIATPSSTNGLLAAQALLSDLGFKDLQPEIYQAEQVQHDKERAFIAGLQAYTSEPENENYQHALKPLLEKVIEDTQADIVRFQKLQHFYQQQAMEEAASIGAASYFAQAQHWVMGSIKEFFGSTTNQQVEKYAELISKRQTHLKQLQALLKEIDHAAPTESTSAKVNSALETIELDTAELLQQQAAGGSSRAASRRLLQAGQNIADYCYPTGRCDLSSLANGLGGFVLQGEVAEDVSGYCVNGAGDINGDGIDDLVVGASANPVNRTAAGNSYVVFGSRSVTAWNIGRLDLSSLMDGLHGFVLQGEAAYDLSGRPVSSGGDINGDGIDDLLVGAPFADPGGRAGAGNCYVVLGTNQTNAWGTGRIDLSSLMNGERGFVFQGEAAGDLSSTSVSGAGDINGDGITDLVIGAPWADPAGRIDAGNSYVVFGTRNTSIWNGMRVDLSSLMDGVRGFVLQGEMPYDYSGYSVSSGDINGDGISDLVIGAYSANPVGRNNTGSTYVMFGTNQTNVWGTGRVDLLDLMDGVRGFVLQGEEEGDESGYSVDGAGDINGDGIDDLILGAHLADPVGRVDAGSSYVVFGTRTSSAWNGGRVGLSSLMDGIRGFVLQGEAASDRYGKSVSHIMDINNDGIEDLVIGAWFADPPGRPNAGNNYVVFGNAMAGAWGTGRLDMNQLMNGMRGFVLQGESAYGASGYSVSTAGDINGDGIGDVVISEHYADPVGRLDAGNSFIIFGNAAPINQPPVLLYNNLILRNGEALVIGQPLLASVDDYTEASYLWYSISNMAHGHMEFITSPGIPIVQFIQANLTAGQIQFVHDDSYLSPNYEVVVSDGVLNSTSSVVNVTFVFPRLLKNQLTISNREQVLFSFNQLQASEPTFNDSALVFSIGFLKQGSFIFIPTNQSISEFSQAQIEQGQVRFIHPGNLKTPSYYVSVSDGEQVTSPQAAAITFIGAPTINQNNINITQGSTITLTPSDLNITVTDGSAPGQVTLEVLDIQHATITSNITGTAVNNFTLTDLQAGHIQLTQDGGDEAPSYIITATSSNSGASSPPSTVDSTFSRQGIFAPRLRDNFLWVIEGESQVLTLQNLRALTQAGQVVNDSAGFYVTDIAHGQFSLTNQPDFSTSFFSQAQLKNGLVQYTHDGSEQMPAYRVSVRYLDLQSPSLSAAIFFRRVNDAPFLENPLTDQVIEAGKPWSYVVPSNTFSDEENDPLTLSLSTYNNTGLPTWLSFSAGNQRLSGTPLHAETIQLAVTATDPGGLSAAADFKLTVLPQARPKHDTSLDGVIAAAAVSGSIGLLFFAVKLGLKRVANKKLLDALGEGKDHFDLNVVRPVAQEVARRVKITGLMNYTVKFRSALH